MPSTKELHKKFYEWFRDPVSADPPSPAEAGHSIGDSVPTDLLFPNEAHYSRCKKRRMRVYNFKKIYKTRRRYIYDLQKLSDLFIYGFRGAVSVGLGASVLTFIRNFSYMRWDNVWPDQIIVIFLVMVLGFWGGLSIGSIYKLYK